MQIIQLLNIVLLYLYLLLNTVNAHDCHIYH